MEQIRQMNVEQLRAEHARLKAGKVGTGFDKQYLTQCIALVDRELKAKQQGAPEWERSSPKVKSNKANENVKSVQAPKA